MIKKINFSIILLLFLFFLTIGSVCGVDDNITNSTTIINEISYDEYFSNESLYTNNENNTVTYSSKYNNDTDVLNWNPTYDYNKNDCYFRANNIKMYIMMAVNLEFI